MKKQALILILGLFFNLTIAQQPDVKKLTTEFDKVLKDEFKPGGTGATVLVARKGQIIYKKGFGMANLESGIPMQADHVFRIGSITKQFTAVAIMRLAEEGKLNLQDEITRFIPDYPTHGHKITIEHLLTHTSGIQSYTSMKDYRERMTRDVKPEEMIAHFKNQPMKFIPGTQWDYSNSGYFLLGYIIEKASGKSYADYLEDNFFKPLGMKNSLYGSDSKIVKNRVGAYRQGKNGFENALPLSMTQPYAAGSIQSTVEDLFKWNQSIHAFKVLKKESLAMAFIPYKLADGSSTDYGYGWQLGYVQGSRTIEHGGAINGTMTMAIYLPEEDVFVAVFSNCECYSPEDLAAKLAAIAIGKPYTYKEIALQNPVLQGYAGVYENSKGEQRILTVADNKLYSQRGRNPKFLIKAYQEDKFFFEDVLVTMEFTRQANGEIEKLLFRSRGGDETWHRTNKPVSSPVEIKVPEKLLETYAGEYELAPEFTFVVTPDQGRLFIQATGQEKFEVFAEAENKFFAKINDAQFEFIMDGTGKVVNAILNQGGRKAEAKKIR